MPPLRGWEGGISRGENKVRSTRATTIRPGTEIEKSQANGLW